MPRQVLAHLLQKWSRPSEILGVYGRTADCFGMYRGRCPAGAHQPPGGGRTMSKIVLGSRMALGIACTLQLACSGAIGGGGSGGGDEDLPPGSPPSNLPKDTPPET